MAKKIYAVPVNQVFRGNVYVIADTEDDAVKIAEEKMKGMTSDYFWHDRIFNAEYVLDGCYATESEAVEDFECVNYEDCCEEE